MKNHLKTALLFLISSAACAQMLTPEERRQFDAVEPAQTIVFSPNDSEALRMAKAARCIPAPRQVDWQQLEFTCFIHFGPNTFSGVEWGNGMEQAETFNPTKVDTDQWCRVAKEAGMKMMMITVKHHDGYCTWQTRYNDHFSVKKSPWKNGKGDVLRQLVDSCKKQGLKLGVYLSPADLYQIENKAGLYGNLSKYRESTIPTDPKFFRSNPTKGRKPPAGKPTFTYEVDDYNRYMLNQLYELLTEYGPIHEVWFDGAHPKRKGGQKYTKLFWYAMIRELAPEAVIFGGPDIRWCGNEAGHTRPSEWSPIPIEGDPEDSSTWKLRGWGNDDLGSRSLLGSFGDFIHWFPSEVDTSIRHGWFWRDEQQHVRNAEEVYEIYEKAVGGNSVLLLNVPPNRDGVFGARDTRVLLDVGKRIQATYGKTAARLIAGGNVYIFNQPATINRCMIMEDVATHGQRVEKHALDAWIDGEWKEIATAATIGYKRILRFPDITTTKIRLRVLEQRLEAKISHVSVHYDLTPLKTPGVSRDREGTVTIKGSGSIHYTLDGSAPVAYTAPFALPKGGTVKAIASRGDERSEIATIRFDIAKAKWEIHAVSSQNPGSGEGAEKAIDGDPATLWHSKWSGGEDPMPHMIAIDFGEALDLKGLTYLPRAGGVKGGTLDQFRVELSRDGKKWMKAAEGRFDNIENDPTQREIRFEKSAEGIRYLRFTGLHSIEDKPHSSAAEIGVLTR